jgi:integrase
VAIREGKFFDVRKESKLAFGTLCDRYLKEYAVLHKKPRSVVRNEASAKVLKAFFGEQTLIKNIQPQDVTKFIVHRKDQGKSPYTINGDLAHLSHMFTWACKLKLATHHPAKGLGRLKTPIKERYLCHEEIQQLLAATSGDLKDMIIVALGTGMRASEVLGLDRDQLDIKNAVVKLNDSKNGDRRLVPLPPQVITTLQQRPAPLRKLFPGWPLDKLMHTINRVAKKASLQGVTFHTLRHTFASHAVMAGVDLYTLAKLLGHRDLAQVQRYAHLAPAHLQAATNQAATAIFADQVPRPMPHEQGAVA